MTHLDGQPDREVRDLGQAEAAVQLLEPRLVPLGGLRAMTVYRTLPQRGRTLVGAWCFLDHYGPDRISETGGMLVPRHPHTGLATVSWLFSGTIHHLDSGGNAAAVVPGELNLMIAGRGITHQEISDPETRVLHGVQLWYALPEGTRFGDNAFIHYVPDPVQRPGAAVRVFIGELLASRSPVQTRTPDLLGAEIVLDPGATLTVDARADFEYAVLAESGSVLLDGHEVAHRSLAYLPPGQESITLTAGEEGVRVILLGGVPLGEQIVMWWNFVGRSHEEIAEYRRRYQTELGLDAAAAGEVGQDPLFGDFPPGQPQPIPAPALPTVRLRPRA